jgi:Tol biopolymer transport system component
MVTMKSNSSFDLASSSTSPAAFIHGVVVGTQPTAVSWSPDGRFLAVVSQSSNFLQIFRFYGSGYPIQVGGNVTGLNVPRAVTWSPDGRFIAFVNEGVTTGVNVVSVYSFNGVSTPTLVGNASSAVSGNGPYWVSWSPDGRYLATVYQSTNKLEIFSFTGSGTLPSVGSASTGSVPTSVAWSPDGKFIAVVNQTAVTMQIFSVSGGVPSSSPVGNVSTAPSPFAVSWSPDGRFIAVVCNSATGSMQIFRFYGSADSTPSQVGSSISTGNTATCVSWSPDGRFLAVVAINSNTLQIYKFNGYSTPTQVDSNISTGAGPNWVTWSPDGRYIAVANQGVGHTMQIFGVNYIVGQTTQAFSNAIVFGNSALGAAYDLNVGVLAGANIVCDGILNYDCVS